MTGLTVVKFENYPKLYRYFQRSLFLAFYCRYSKIRVAFIIWSLGFGRRLKSFEVEGRKSKVVKYAKKEVICCLI